MIQSEFWWFLVVFYRPDALPVWVSWIIINDMTEITNILSKAIMFLLHQVSYTLHTQYGISVVVVYHGRDLFILVFCILLRVFLHFVARFVVVIGFTRIRSKCADIKTLHPTSVAAVFLISVLFLWPSRVKRCQITDLFFSRPRDLMLWISSLAEQRTQGQSTNLGPDLQNILRFMISLS